jgi:lipopolysaccharide export system permease protein
MAPKAGPRVLNPRERDIGDLLYPDESTKYYQDNKHRFRSEIHERFSAGVYAIVFAILATVYLARPRTTREGRAGVMFTAFTIGALIRLVGIAGINMVGKNPSAVWLIYGVPAVVSALGLLMLRFNIPAPALSMPRLRLPWPLSLIRRRAGAVLHTP